MRQTIIFCNFILVNLTYFMVNTTFWGLKLSRPVFQGRPKPYFWEVGICSLRSRQKHRCKQKSRGMLSPAQTEAPMRAVSVYGYNKTGPFLFGAG